MNETKRFLLKEQVGYRVTYAFDCTMAECIMVPAMFGAMACLFKCSVKSETSSQDKNKVVPYDEERPRKMTPYELEMYRLHMNAYGRNIHVERRGSS